MKSTFALALLLACAACTQVVPGSDTGTEFRPANAEMHAQLAASALDKGDLEGARANAAESLRLDGEGGSRGSAARTLARTELLLGSPREALAAARRAVAVSQEDADTWLLVAECATQAGESSEARFAFDRAASLGSAEARLALAGDALADHDETLIRELLRQSPDEQPAIGLYAQHLSATGRAPEALALIDAALERHPGDRALELARDRLRLEVPGAALPAGGPARSLEGGLILAAADLKSGRASEAAARYREIAGEMPDDAAPRIGLGEALLALGDGDGALAAFDGALAIEPKSLDALLGSARVHLAAKRYLEAFDPLERAVVLAPQRAAVRGLLVAAAKGSGNLARAREEALAVRRIEPGGPLDLKCREVLAAPGSSGARAGGELH